ncbi:MAG: hypothetical protein QOE33_3388 [Acidobacteriota bacterium]|nr:hypothetical protein [Acidobacteriota bacterium]
MRVEVSKFGGLARRLTLIVFALWLAGAGHLACCGSTCDGEAVAAAPASELSHEHAPDAMGTTDACCHARIRHEQHAGAQHGSDAALGESDSARALTTPPAPRATSHCCVSAGQVADRAMRPRIRNGLAGASTTRHLSRPRVASSEDSSSAPALRVPDRGRAYLRDCAFLI